MNNAAKVALHPITIAMALLSFFSVEAPAYFHLPSWVAWVCSLLVGLGTLVVAQMKATHSSLALDVDQQHFGMIVSVCTVGSMFIQVVLVSLTQGTVATETTTYGGAVMDAPFVVPLYIIGVLSILKGFCDTLANQLRLPAMDGGSGPAVMAPVETVAGPATTLAPVADAGVYPTPPPTQPVA